MEGVDIGIWAAGAVAVVGIIQWGKGLLPKAPSWVWSAVLPLAALGVGLAADGGTPLYNACGIWAISQIGYELIVQGIIARLTPKAKP